MDPHNAGNRLNLITVNTDYLRERLNTLYDSVRSSEGTACCWGRFDYLWDLKELAMLEGLKSVKIPDQWLDELERIYVDINHFSGRSH